MASASVNTATDDAFERQLDEAVNVIESCLDSQNEAIALRAAELIVMRVLGRPPVPVVTRTAQLA
jgi:hypothetical protein